MAEPLPPGTPVIVTGFWIDNPSPERHPAWLYVRSREDHMSIVRVLHNQVVPANDYTVVPKALLREVVDACDELIRALSRGVLNSYAETIIPYHDISGATDALRPYCEGRSGQGESNSDLRPGKAALYR